MRSLFAVMLAAVVFSGIAGAAEADGWGESGACNYRRYGLDAEKFFSYLTQDSPYTSWPRCPGHEKLQPGEGPHNAYFTTYMNPVACRLITLQEEMAVGSLIVTENYTQADRLASLSVKIRIKDYDPASGDWYWFLFSPEGKALVEGRAEECLGCHTRLKRAVKLRAVP